MCWYFEVFVMTRANELRINRLPRIMAIDGLLGSVQWSENGRQADARGSAAASARQKQFK